MKRALAVGISAAVLTGLLSVTSGFASEPFHANPGRRLTLDRQPPMHGRIPVAMPRAPRQIDPRVHVPRQFDSRFRATNPHPRGHDGPRHFHRGGGVVGSGPVVVYTPGYVADSGSAYAPPPVYYGPTPTYAYPPAATVEPEGPSPRVIEYPGGRYELRGDGIDVPHSWVWVPNPPPAPPAAAEPARTGPAPVATPAAGRSALYTWTDRDGVVHWTDNANGIPEEYRSKVQKRSL